MALAWLAKLSKGSKQMDGGAAQIGGTYKSWKAPLNPTVVDLVRAYAP